MKKTITISTFITSLFLSISLAVASGTSGSAGGSKGMTCEEIQFSVDFKVDFQVYEIEKYSVHYDELCLAPNEMISTKKRYLVGWKNDSTTDFLYVYDYLKRPREIIRNICVPDIGGNCTWEEEVDSIPLEQPVNIYRFDRSKLIWQLDDTRNYQLNNCETYRNY